LLSLIAQFCLGLAPLDVVIIWADSLKRTIHGMLGYEPRRLNKKRMKNGEAEMTLTVPFNSCPGTRLVEGSLTKFRDSYVDRALSHAMEIAPSSKSQRELNNSQKAS
jgi:hypothetical protein